MRLSRPRLRGRHLLLGAGACVIAVLPWPAGATQLAVPTEPTAFRWDADGLFAELEAELGRAVALAPAVAAAELDTLVSAEGRLLELVRSAAVAAPPRSRLR